MVTREGLILTAAHVLDNAAAVKTIAEERLLGLELLALDPERDLALLRAPPGSGPWTPAAFRRRPPRLGEAVLLFGYPARGLAARRAPTLTRGLVSAAVLDIGGAASRFQTDAASNPGSSGCPALDASGAVIGLVAESGRPATAEDQSFVLPCFELEEGGYLRIGDAGAKPKEK